LVGVNVGALVVMEVGALVVGVEVGAEDGPR